MKNRPQKVRQYLVGQGRVVGGMFGTFLSQAHQCHEEMTNLQDILQQAYQLFSAGRDVWQTHCDSVISSLTRFKAPVERFCALLRNTSDFPAVLSHHAYPLIVTLYQVDEQGSRIKSLITTYRSTCQAHAQQLVGQKYEIHCELKKLIYYSEEALQEVEHLIDETYFLERQRLFSDERCQSERAYQTNNQYSVASTDREWNNIIPLHREKLSILQDTTVNPAYLVCLPDTGQVKTPRSVCTREDKA